MTVQLAVWLARLQLNGSSVRKPRAIGDLMERHWGDHVPLEA
ncbi:hypothetical protein [Fundicoccus ignavus]|nr:hypothetical protein [Fundicoccus ignavus]